MAKPKLKCICRGNWRQIVSECEGLFDRRFVSNEGKEYTFFGLVHASDDYYYGMYSKEHGTRLLTCVGSIDGAGFKLVDNKKGETWANPSYTSSAV